MYRRCLSTLFVAVAFAPAVPAQPPVIAKPDAFPTLVNPMCSHCRDEAKRRSGELKADDRVLCWIRGYSDGGAIPFRFFLNRYPVISDSYGVFVHDPDAGFARGFAPSYDFTFHGWRNGVMVMKHKDGTLYSCLTGIAFDGPKKGEMLKAVPTLVSDWGPWVDHYPQNVAYHMFDKYQPVEAAAKAHPDALKSRGPADKRLPEKTPVLGVRAGEQTRAYPLERIAKAGFVADDLDGKSCVVLWQEATRTAAAYRPIAASPKKGVEPRAVTLHRDAKVPHALVVDKETGSHWDIAGRAVDGELKDWTLEWLDGTQVSWFAWAAEYPATTIYGDKKEAGQKAKDAIREIAGTAEWLRAVPKKFAAVKGIDIAKNTVILRIEGETADTTWPLTPDAEIKIAGWWGRLSQLEQTPRVWAWFHVDRKKKPVAIFMLADESSEKDTHSAKGDRTDSFEHERKKQQTWLYGEWSKAGMPGTVGYVAVYNGEADILVDHEAMRWARSLKAGDKVELAAEPPIKGVVKSVMPLREKTQVRLVVRSFDLADVTTGRRVYLKMTPPAKDLYTDPLPPDIDQPRKTKEERIEWFLASIYCTCGVTGDGCTGHAYTLASCNPNACGAPNMTRKLLAKKIDDGLTDRQIFEELHKDRGPLMLRPHLLP